MLVPPDYSLHLPAEDLDAKRDIGRLLAELIIREVPPPIGPKGDPDGQWTTNLRIVLSKAIAGSEFRELDWKYIPDNPGKPESAAGEFLVDFVWWRARQVAVLVVESEWNQSTKEILKDFDKIAPIKSPFKLMLYSSKVRGDHSAELKREFEAYLSAYQQHIKGETYVFVEFMRDDRVKAFLWQATESGSASNALLQEILSEKTFSRPQNS